MTDLIRNDPVDVAKHIRNNVSSGPAEDPITNYQSKPSGNGQMSIGLRTSLLGEEMDLIEDRPGISILEVVGHDADYFRRHPESEEEIELILSVERRPQNSKNERM